jgi:hypothetical protein
MSHETKSSLVNQSLMALGLRKWDGGALSCRTGRLKADCWLYVIPAPTQSVLLIAKLRPRKKLSDVELSVCRVSLRFSRRAQRTH